MTYKELFFLSLRKERRRYEKDVEENGTKGNGGRWIGMGCFYLETNLAGCNYSSFSTLSFDVT